MKLALAGAAITAFLASITSAILLLDITTLDQFRFWVVGSLANRDADIAKQVAPFIIVGTALALVAGRSLNAMALGDDVARSLGQRVGALAAISGVTIVLLVGAAVAAARPIVFVGLSVPHVARAIGGRLPLDPALLGRARPDPARGRRHRRPGGRPAILGAPLFIALVRYRKLAEL